MVLTQERRRRPVVLILGAGVGQRSTQGIHSDVRTVIGRGKQALDGEHERTSRAYEEHLEGFGDVNGT